VSAPVSDRAPAVGSLAGRVAFVTGAARGQGRSHAVTLAEAGADVVVTDITKDIESARYPLGTAEDLAETERQIGALGRRVLARTVDVRRSGELDAVVAEANEFLGGIDIVCANAGIGQNFHKTWELSDEEWHDVLDVNLTGVFQTVRAVVPSMIERRRGGSIILTSSLAGLKGYSNIAAYVASKHGVNGLMRTLANELGPHSIRVNSVCPGLINTAMMMNQPTYAVFRPELENPTQVDATEVFRTMQVLPTDWLEPRDVSEVIRFLASDEARFLTGLAIPVDAGQIGRG
jgi:SDR family mycofactocin-dependent oxidoreductase